MAAVGLDMRDLFVTFVTCSSANGTGRPADDLQARNDALLSRHAQPVELRTIDAAIPSAFHLALCSDPARLTWLLDRRGLTQATVEQRQLGFDPRSQRFTIPVRDEAGRCVNIRKYHPNPGPNQSKMISWRQGFGGARLYPLDALAAPGPIVILAGELDTLLALQHGINAITSTGGEGNARPWASWASLFRDCDVAICYDHDPAGRQGALKVAAALRGVATRVRVVDWPAGKPGGYDYTDHWRDGGTAEDFRAMIDAAPEWAPSPEQPATVTRRVSPTELLIAIATEEDELWRDPDGEAYATVCRNGAREHYPVGGSNYGDWLAHRFYRQHQRTAPTQALKDAIREIAGRGQFGEAEHVVHLRVAESPGRIVLDLADAERRAVVVTAEGWTVGDCPEDVRFRRPAGQQALPVPVRGGAVDLLRQHLNVSDDASFVLLVAYLLSAMRESGPRPVLSIIGEQGSAKSSTARNILSLVDPGDLRSPPRDEEAVAIAARHAWVLSYDNMTTVSGELSNTLCRVSTGGMLGRRTLYRNDDETRFPLKRSVILTSIGRITSRADLQDRAIVISLPTITDARRRDEATLKAGYEAARPMILGALLDAVSMALRNIDSVRLPTLPRMADFARWVVAAEPALPWEPGTFMRVYAEDRARAAEHTLAADAFGTAVVELVEAHGGRWSGTVTAMLSAIASRSVENVRHAYWFPTTAQQAGNRIAVILPALRQLGFDALQTRQGHAGTRVWTIQRTEDAVEEVPF